MTEIRHAATVTLTDRRDRRFGWLMASPSLGLLFLVILFPVFWAFFTSLYDYTLINPNFDTFTEWNNSLVYATTAAYFATRITGAGKVHRGSGADLLSVDGVKEVQKLLQARGYNVGKVDGIIGAQTRAAVKDVQLKLGLPADSYPDKTLLARFRSGA